MIVLTMTAATPARAQFAELNTVNIKAVQATPVTGARPVPANAERTLEKGYSQGSTWFHYETMNTSEQDGSSVQMDFTADEASNGNYQHYSFGKLLVRFYTATDIEDPAKVYLTFKPGDAGMNYNVPSAIKKTMTHAKDENGFYYYADISEEVGGARLEANGQIFTQELSVTKRLPEGGSVTYKMPGVRLFDSIKDRYHR